MTIRYLVQISIRRGVTFLRQDFLDSFLIDDVGSMDAPEFLPLGGASFEPGVTDALGYVWGHTLNRRMDDFRGPAGSNGVAAGVVAPAAPGQRVRTRRPRVAAPKPDGCNLDRTGMRLVRKGTTVRCVGAATQSWLVIKVNRGECWVRDPWHGSRDFRVRCSSVLVVPS